MSKRIEVRCEDCYFRRSGLCALQLSAPCPIFRHHAEGVLTPPRQARLIMRPVEAPHGLVPQHQAA